MQISQISSLALISLLAAMSPGPDFAIVMKQSLLGSFRSGCYTAFGVASAIIIHVSYCVLGVALLISKSPTLFSGIKYTGAFYLFYLGISLLKEKIKNTPLMPCEKKSQTPFVSGFLCNLLNPKATLFILSLFTQFVDPSQPASDKWILGGVVIAVTLFWFILLSFLINHRLIRNSILQFQTTICKVMGLGLCLLALHLVFKN